MIPPHFVGVWRRVSISLGDEPPTEPCDVLWLQATSFFADLRMPRSPACEPVAFAGFTTWDEPRLTWHHVIDRAPAGPDIGTVEWRGSELVERGMTLVAGTEIPYEEVWRRVSRSSELPILALAREDGTRGCDAMVVRVGSHSLSMGDTRRGFAARAERWFDGCWHVIGELGTPETLPRALDPDPGWRVGQRIELRGTGSWIVRASECV